MSKITAYAALTSVQSDDVLPVVDVHDTSMASSGTTKKVTAGNLLQGPVIPPSGDLTGVTDTAAINAVAQAGKVAQLQAGTYHVGNLLPDSFGGVAGVGNATILQAVSGTTGYVIAAKTPATTRYVKIRNLAIDCQSLAGVGGISLDNTGLSAGTPGFHKLNEVTVSNSGTSVYGFSFTNAIEIFGYGLVASNAQNIGFNVGCTDSRFVSCTAAGAVSHGWNIFGDNSHFTLCKAYFTGNNGSIFTGTGHGFYVPGNTRCVTFDACEAQDCGTQGFYFDTTGGGNVNCTLIGCILDSCNAVGLAGASGVGVSVNALQRSAIVGNTAVNRAGGAGTMTYLFASSGSNNGTFYVANMVNGLTDELTVVSGGGYTFLSGESMDVSHVTKVKVPALVLNDDGTQTIANSGTILTATDGTNSAVPITAAGNVTGIILEPPSLNFMQITVINHSAFTITFAASGTSHVADGTSDVIPALCARVYTYDGNTSLWYRAG